LNGFIWAKTGVEGSGKSLEMTYWSLKHLNGGGIVSTFPNYSIHRCGRPDQKLSLDLDMRRYFQAPYDYQDQIIDADEIQNFADSAISGAVFARLLSRVLAQRRKIRQGVLYTTQNWQWAHNRVRWLTHFLSVCTDLCWTSWGKSEQLKRGEVLQFATFDCKGFMTGEAWKLISVKRLLAKRYWNYYDTSAVVDIFAGETQWLLKKHRETLDLRSSDEISNSLKFGQSLISNLDPDVADPMGVRYTQQREHDNFQYGQEAIEQAKLSDIDRLEAAFRQGLSGTQIGEIAKRLKEEREQNA